MEGLMPRGADPPLTPGLVVIVTERNGDVRSNHHHGAGMARPLPGRLRERGVADRTFVLEVRQGEPPLVVIPGRFSDQAVHLELMKVWARRRMKEARDHGLATTPAGGAGVTVWRGAVSVASVTYEPLPPRRR
jgi:hypothetical protein